jgi:hypothetical protein
VWVGGGGWGGYKGRYLDRVGIELHAQQQPCHRVDPCRPPPPPSLITLPAGSAALIQGLPDIPGRNGGGSSSSIRRASSACAAAASLRHTAPHSALAGDSMH